MIVKIKSKKIIAQETILVDFDITDKEINFKPGQFCSVVLLKPPYNDEHGGKRFFSILNSPNEKRVLTIATRLSDSAFKKSLQEMKIGSEVEIGVISGKFVLPENTSLPLVFIAGGIGITPFISMLRYIKEESLDYKITLLYSNRNRETSAFLDELENFAKENQKFKLVLTINEDKNWHGEKRFIDFQFIKDYVAGLFSCLYYTAGPVPMVKTITSALKLIGINFSNIKTENFVGY
jgi:ferredoxin-NADP reductase